ncbi:MAG: pyridoxal phosphate-dependent aminotransferase family protein [bacterium]|nr:pyridoxal phosphate-dependent aminotransferase family protein [bacterium]
MILDQKTNKSKAGDLHFINDFYKLYDLPIQERTGIFSNFFRDEVAKGLPVHREIQSPADNRVQIKDTVTGETREVVMFGSNNYLGLANHPGISSKISAYIEECGIGLGGPPLLNGTTSLHKRLERRLAQMKDADEALLYSSGFSANYGLITSLVGKNDALIMDELSHASLVEGARLCRGTKLKFSHNNMKELEEALRTAEKAQVSNKFVVVEGVYSMNGDIAPLNEVYEITKKYNGFLIVDDAHGTGIMGKNGRGTAEHFGLEGKIDLSMGTFSKALASSGGYIAGNRSIIDYLRFFSKTYFFSAAMPPMLIAQVMASLDVMEEEPQLKTKLYANVVYILTGLRRIGFDVSTQSAIIPLYVSKDTKMRELAREVDLKGVFVNHIEYPAVPVDKQRFRISAMASHTQEDMDILISTFKSIKDKI